MLATLMEYLGYLNNSKFFAGVVMIMLNVGSKYITGLITEKGISEASSEGLKKLFN